MFRKRHAAWRAYRRFKTNKHHEKYVKLDSKYKQAVRNFVVNKEPQLIDNVTLGSSIDMLITELYLKQVSVQLSLIQVK